MKKIFAPKLFVILLLTTLAACGTMEKSEAPAHRPANSASAKVNPKDALKDLKLGCSNIKAVNDPEHGKIFYTSSHNLFKYVKIDKSKGDRYLCSAGDAEKGGFSPAPEHFSGSVYYFVECLHQEGSTGKCHDYASGIYQSLAIYEKVCGTKPSKVEIAETVESYAKREKDAMDSGKYEGVTAALINKYRCKK